MSRPDIALATGIATIMLSSGMASTSIQPKDITGSKSELSERWRVWLRGFTYFAEGKANLQTSFSFIKNCYLQITFMSSEQSTRLRLQSNFFTTAYLGAEIDKTMAVS